MRQSISTDFDPKRGCSIASLAYEYAPRFDVPVHAHGSDQLIYAVSGVMEVSSGRNLWLIPPQFAIWIPTGTFHQIRMPRAVSMRTLYVRTGMAGLPSECRVLHVNRFLRELIVEAVRIGQLRTRDRLHCALRDLLLAQLRDASPVPTQVTLPVDSRALAVAQTLLGNENGECSLEKLCRGAGASVRTIERTFRREVGVDFSTWRRHARLMKAIGLLAGGRSVKETAYDIGYSQPSTFVAMFRKTFGATPKAWTTLLLR